jgi:diacylglycerol kinase (ATP)
MKKNICFIINPKSGIHTKRNIPGLINRFVDKAKYEFEICYTEKPKHAVSLAKEAAEKKYHAVISVGGDGSANEVATGILGTETALGFIPTGSGNGMARHLKIPMNLEKAIHVINSGKIEKVDTLEVNNGICLGTIGIGFDAHIAHLFALSARRGFYTYAKLVLREFRTYQASTYQLIIDEKTFSKKCFLLTIANSSQFGNNAVIAPYANVQDGIIDVSIIEKFSFFAVPKLAYQLMNNLIYRSKYFSMMTGKDIVLKNTGELKGHVDGEPLLFNSDIHIKIIPLSLNVIIP